MVSRLLLARGLTVGVAESLTGGLLSATLTEPAGASEYFRGGLVVYATDLKARLADVPRQLLDVQGPVCAEVAIALARGAREWLDADLGIGITGVAGPDPVGDHPAGTVYIAVAGAAFIEVSRECFRGSRPEVREASVTAALALLVTVLTAEHPGMPDHPAALRYEQT